MNCIRVFVINLNDYWINFALYLFILASFVNVTFLRLEFVILVILFEILLFSVRLLFECFILYKYCLFILIYIIV